MKLKRIVLLLFLLIIITDFFQINYTVSKNFSIEAWKNSRNRDGMSYSLIKNNKEVIENEEKRKVYLGKTEHLAIRNNITGMEEYRYPIQGYKLSEKGIILKKKSFLIFYNSKNMEHVITEEYYIFNILVTSFIKE